MRIFSQRARMGRLTLTTGLAIALATAQAACGAAHPRAEAGSSKGAPSVASSAPASRIAPVGKMTLHRIADGKLFVTDHGAYLFSCHPITVARVDRGATTPMPALETALVEAKVACIDAIEEPVAGRLLFSALVDGEAAWVGWSSSAIERVAPPRRVTPARLVAPVDESGNVTDATLRGEIAIEPGSRYPRSATPVKRMRGQLALPGGGLVVIGHLDDGTIAAEVWRAPDERGRAEALPAAPPWSNWDPFLSPRAAVVASAGPGHACAVPTAIAETLAYRYLACLDGEHWRSVETDSLDGVVHSLAGAEGWIWAATMAEHPGVFRMRVDGGWERVGALADGAEYPTIRMRSAREVYVSADPANWVALEAP